ncbi:unnamed protein product [Boreogadus saida]
MAHNVVTPAYATINIKNDNSVVDVVALQSGFGALQDECNVRSARGWEFPTHCELLPEERGLVTWTLGREKVMSFIVCPIERNATSILTRPISRPHSGVVPRHVGNDVDALIRRCGDMKQHVVHLFLERWRRACFYALTVPAPPYAFGFHM